MTYQNIACSMYLCFLLVSTLTGMTERDTFMIAIAIILSSLINNIRNL